MKRFVLLTLALLCASLAFAQPAIPHRASEDTEGVMSPAYWALWNDEVQARIDADIERNRKADGFVKIPGLKRGTPVQVEQVSSAFLFGASTFNFNQLGTPEANERYRELFGTLFNRATVGLYWRDFQWFRESPMRYSGEFRDTIVILKVICLFPPSYIFEIHFSYPFINPSFSHQKVSDFH